MLHHCNACGDGVPAIVDDVDGGYDSGIDHHQSCESLQMSPCDGDDGGGDGDDGKNDVSDDDEHGAVGHLPHSQRSCDVAFCAVQESGLVCYQNLIDDVSGVCEEEEVVG